jgi:hypothetical protein
VFVPGKPFTWAPIFAGKARGLLSSVTLALAQAERLVRDKRSSLLDPFLSYKEKKLIMMVPDWTFPI